jgi:hypothetical protein
MLVWLLFAAVCGAIVGYAAGIAIATHYYTDRIMTCLTESVAALNGNSQALMQVLVKTSVSTDTTSDVVAPETDVPIM